MTAPPPGPAPPPVPALPTIDACAQVFEDAVQQLFLGLSTHDRKVKDRNLLKRFHDDKVQAESLIIFLRPSVHYLTNIIDRS
jgi:hypothetical protein